MPSREILHNRLRVGDEKIDACVSLGLLVGEGDYEAGLVAITERLLFLTPRRI